MAAGFRMMSSTVPHLSELRVAIYVKYALTAAMPVSPHRRTLSFPAALLAALGSSGSYILPFPAQLSMSFFLPFMAQ